MPVIRYRPTIGRLLEKLMSGGVEDVAEISVRKIAEHSGVSRQTVYAWIAADSDNEETWLERYDPEVERKFRLFFSRLFDGEVIQAVERKTIDTPFPNLQEMAVVVATYAT